MEQPLQNFETQSLKSSVDLDNCCAGVLVFREAILCQIGCFFTHCVKGEGGSNPCVKIYVANLYNSGGLLAT